MNKSKLGSIFLKEIDQYERSVVGGMTARIFIMVLLYLKTYMIDDDFTAFGNNMEVTYGNSAFSQAKDVHEWN